MIRSLFLLWAGVLLAWQAAATELPLVGWEFSNGSEFPGAAGSLHVDGKVPFNGKKSLELFGDFRKGGRYVAASRTLEPAKELREVQFKLKGNASRVEVRLVDSEGQVHQHFFPLTGNPAIWQCVDVPVAGSPEHHWFGRNDGVLRGPIRAIAVVLPGNDLPGKVGSFRLADFRTFEIDRLTTSEVRIPANRFLWALTRGAEFSPGADAALDADGERLLLKVDTSKHGRYAGVWYRFPTVDAKRLKFEMRGANRKVAVRFQDRDRQVHQFVLQSSGNPAETQKFVIDVTGSQTHWGGKNDGVFHGPLTEIAFCVGGEYYGAGKKGETEFRNIALETNDPVGLWSVADPVALFRRIGDSSPVQIQTNFSESPKPEQLRYSYRNYEGSEVAAGVAAYDAKNRTLSAPPPAGRGFFELCYPEFGIRLGLAVDEPPPAEFDEYFAVDSSFTWGPPPYDEKEIRAMLRIFKQNGILWNRDRFNWYFVEKERGNFDFDDSHWPDRHSLYRRIATEEGIKDLDNCGVAPAWIREQPERAFRDPRRNPYPIDLFAAGESWSTIVKHYSVIKAHEVWNEPDISICGNNFPAEYVTALTKAVSRSFADHNVEALIVGGVFAETRPGTNFYQTYIDNGLLDDSDVISFHSYREVPALEPQVAALRQAELDSKTPRAGIPYWITECGMPRPWVGSSRGAAEPDLYSACEITGKAAEMRALGLERYFLFEIKHRKENMSHFGQFDYNLTPMRGIVAYLHAVRALAHRDYVGDLKDCGVVRGRVFEGKDDLVAVLYNGTRKSRKFFVQLPKGFRAQRATGIDGRPLKIENGRVANADGITYVYFDKTAKGKFVDSETRAMKLYRLAKAYRPQPRAVRPLVLQPMTDLAQCTITNRGLFVPKDGVELKFRVNNFGKTALTFAPEFELPKGAKLLTQPGEAVTVPPRGMAEIAFRVVLAPDTADFQTLRIGDRDGNATPIAFSLAPFHREELVLSAMPEGTKSPATLAELEKLGNWVDFSGAANWTPMEGDKTSPDIEAKFRGFYTPQELVFQVLVRDEQHVNARSAFESWLGDSIQLAVQQRQTNKLSPADQQYHEIAAAQCAEGKTLYAHIGTPAGKLVKSKLDFRPVGKNWFLYEIRLNGKELGLSLKPGSVIGSSLLVNSNPGRGRAGFLSWGSGIALEKSDAFFQILLLQ